jgi:hypothetical protein
MTAVIAVLIVAGAAITLWFRSHGQRPAEHVSAPGQEVAVPEPPDTTKTRSVCELEEVVYRNPFDADLQLELARAAWKSFEKSMRTDSAAASDAGSAYLAAVFESGSRPEIVAEARKRIDLLASMAGGGEHAFDDACRLFGIAYEKAVKPNIQHILKVRDAIEKACSRIHADERGLGSFVAAQAATERYLQLLYDVEIGRKHVRPAGTNGDFHFTRFYYNNWEKIARSYGIIVQINPDAANSDVYAIGGLSTPIDPALTQFDSGEKFGRFQMPDGREIIPGLRSFEDAAQAAAQEKITSAGHSPDERPGLGDSASVDSPVEMYRKLIELREQGRWSAAFDLFEPETQRMLGDALRSALTEAPEGADYRARINAMSGRELWIVAGRTGAFYPTRILAVQSDGDHATLKVLVIKGSVPEEQTINCIQVDGQWKVTFR